MNTKIVFILLTTLGVYISAQANEAYVGLGVGQSIIKNGQFDENDTGFKVFGGYRFNPNLAVEAAYLNFGKPGITTAGTKLEYEACSAAVWAKGLLPISRNIDLFGKAGWAYWEAKSYTTPSGLPTAKYKWKGNDFTWGAGVGFNQWKSFSIQMEYEEVNNDLDKTGLWSVSGLYRF